MRSTDSKTLLQTSTCHTARNEREEHPSSVWRMPTKEQFLSLSTWPQVLPNSPWTQMKVIRWKSRLMRTLYSLRYKQTRSSVPDMVWRLLARLWRSRSQLIRCRLYLKCLLLMINLHTHTEVCNCILHGLGPKCPDGPEGPKDPESSRGPVVIFLPIYLFF